MSSNLLSVPGARNRKKSLTKESHIKEVVKVVGKPLMQEAKWFEGKVAELDDDIGLISADESTVRLIIYGITCGIVLALISSSLAIQFATLLNKNMPKVVYKRSVVIKRTGFVLPQHLVLTKEDALHHLKINFHEGIVESEQLLQLPKLQDLNYYAFQTQAGELNFVKNDLTAPITTFTSYLNKSMTISKSSISNKYSCPSDHVHLAESSRARCQFEDSAQVGLHFWLFSKFNMANIIELDFFVSGNTLENDNPDTWIWSLKKNKWLTGPLMPIPFPRSTCSVVLNDSMVMFLGGSLSNIFSADIITFNFKTMQWRNDWPKLPLWTSNILSIQFSHCSATVTFGKDYKHQIILLIVYYDLNQLSVGDDHENHLVVSYDLANELNGQWQTVHNYILQSRDIENNRPSGSVPH